MKFSFKSKFLLALTIFSIIPGVQASGNKRSNNASLVAIGAAAGALGGIVAHRLYKKYSQKYTQLPEDKKQAIRSFALNASIGLSSCVSPHLEHNSKLALLATAISMSVCIHKRFHQLLISSYTVNGYPVVAHVGVLGMAVGALIGRGAELAARRKSISSLLTPTAGFASIGVATGLTVMHCGNQWRQQKKEREDKINSRKRAEHFDDKCSFCLTPYSEYESGCFHCGGRQFACEDCLLRYRRLNGRWKCPQNNQHCQLRNRSGSLVSLGSLSR